MFNTTPRWLVIDKTKKTLPQTGADHDDHQTKEKRVRRGGNFVPFVDYGADEEDEETSTGDLVKEGSAVRDMRGRVGTEAASGAELAQKIPFRGELVKLI